MLTNYIPDHFQMDAAFGLLVFLISQTRLLRLNLLNDHDLYTFIEEEIIYFQLPQMLSIIRTL